MRFDHLESGVDLGGGEVGAAERAEARVERSQRSGHARRECRALARVEAEHPADVGHLEPVADIEVEGFVVGAVHAHGQPDAGSGGGLEVVPVGGRLGPPEVAGLIGGEAGVDRFAEGQLANGEREKYQCEPFGPIAQLDTGGRTQEHLTDHVFGRVLVEGAPNGKVPQAGQVAALQVRERACVAGSRRAKERVVVGDRLSHGAEPFVGSRKCCDRRGYA